MKRWLTFLLALMVLTAVPVKASPPKVVDEAGLLTAQEVSALEEHASELAEQYHMDIVILTVYSLDGADPESFADDYYDAHGYGMGDDYSGILLMLSMEDRDWAISTCGSARYAVTDYGIYDIFQDIAPYLAEDSYYSAFTLYLTVLKEHFEAYQNGAPIDGDDSGYDGPGSYIPGTKDEVINYAPSLSAGIVFRRLIAALAIGAAAAALVLLFMRRSMNTARQQSSAQNYMVSGSFNLYRRMDMFLYSHTSRVRKSENNSGGGNSGGGSSVHHSSSGRSHGGGHGKF